MPREELPRSAAGNRNPWLIAVIISIATFMEVLDTTIVNVAPRHIAGSMVMTREKAQVRQHKAESIETTVRGGLPRSSEEADVMFVERRGQVTDVGSGPTGHRRSSNSRRKAAAFDSVARAG